MNCTICLSELNKNKNCIYLDCGHSFHCDCIFKLFTYDKKCPT